MAWKINLNTRSADNGAGKTVQFTRTGTRWAAVPHDDGALVAWERELSRGADALRQVGETLYGDQWKTPLADEIGVSRETPRLWLSGKTPFTLDHPIWPVIVEKLEDRRDTANKLLTMIGKALSRAEAPVSKRYAGNS